MTKQIRMLSAVQLCNLFGINEVRYTKDRGKKSRFFALGIVGLVLVAMLVFYISMLSTALVMAGMADLIPMYLFTLTSLIIMFFTFFKASSVIFQMHTYELLISLPVSKAAIVISRFITMYVTNLCLSLLVMIPGMVIYGIGVSPNISFYAYVLVGTLFLPLLPITLATAVGALITAISARMKHKSMASIILTLAVILGVMGFEMFEASNPAEISMDNIKNLSTMMADQIGRIYPSAVWFGNAAVAGNITDLLRMIGVSLVIFVAMIAILQHSFLNICSALNATSAKNNYKMQKLTTNSVIKALWKRELKRYFASSVYVSNTLVGYLLMAILAIAIFVAGPEKLSSMIGIPVVEKAIPFAMAVTAAIMPITSCSISMEGKQWWIYKTLPISAKKIYDGKILLNMSVALPFYVVAVIFGCLTMRTSIIDCVWIIVIPAVYILFSSVVGITINLTFPVLEWESEVRVVKQGASSMVGMLIGMVSAVVPMVIVILSEAALANVVKVITVVILLVATAFLYRSNGKKNCC